MSRLLSSLLSLALLLSSVVPVSGMRQAAVKALPAATGGGTSTQYQYGYDYRTRRISTTRTGGSQPDTATTIAFAGGLSLAEWDTDGSGTAFEPLAPTVEYTRGPDMGGGVGGLLYSARLETSGSPPSVLSPTLKYNLSNGRGDVVAQSDSSGALTWTASYEAYGKRTKETGQNKDKQRANSKDEDPTGLLNEGFRYRDIETGVWLSRDPAGFVDGPNLYAYVMQNPWTSFDPDGLATKSQLHKQKRELTKRRDAEKAAREKNGEKQTREVSTSLGETVDVKTEFGDVMDAFNGAINGLESRINAIDQAVDNHNFLMDVGSALTGVSQDRMKVSRVQFDDELPQYQNMLSTSSRLQGIKNDVAIGLLTGGAGKLIQVGGKGLRLLSPAGKMMTGCFVAGTLVKTKDGDRPIEKIKKGDLVWSYNQTRKAWELKEVLASFVHKYSGDIYTLQIGNVVIEATANHPFWVTSGTDLSSRPNAEDVPLSEQELVRDGRWVAAEHLRAGDTFRLRDSGFSEISAIKSEPRSIQVFNITVEESHSYAVSEAGVLVHNKAMQRKPGSLGQFKGTDALRAENKVANDAAKAAGLNKDQAKRLHTEISGQGYDYHQILEIAKGLKK